MTSLACHGPQNVDVLTREVLVDEQNFHAQAIAVGPSCQLRRPTRAEARARLHGIWSPPVAEGGGDPAAADSVS